MTARMQALRQRRKDAGLTRVELWAHPDAHRAIKVFATMLENGRLKQEAIKANKENE